MDGMITVIIFAILGAIIGIFIGYNIWQSIGNFIVGAILGFIFGMIVCLILPSKQYMTVTNLKIENLQDNTSAKGSFFIGCGHIDGTMKYVFYHKISDDTNSNVKMSMIDYDKVTIDPDYDGYPYVEIFEKKDLPVDSCFWNYFAADVFNEQTYIIHVPSGTIRNDYKLDAQ